VAASAVEIDGRTARDIMTHLVHAASSEVGSVDLSAFETAER
jgi:hypothetical protein